MKQIAAQLVAAQQDNTPEGRMKQGALLRQILTSGKSMRSKDGTSSIDRLMSKVGFGTSECWFWLGSINRLGYGTFHCEGENKAHRAVYRIFNGPIAEGMKVMHTCDTRNCVNPAHLVVGTQADNVADMVAKGRGKSGDVRGEKNPMAKATPEVVEAIRTAVGAGGKQIEMARKFGLSPMTVSRIVRKESWNG
jgi:hypothetical protein